jgi:GT2 family glycosyltransferase
MLYFFTPYSFEKKLFEAFDHYFGLVGDEDWICLTDGDTAFLRSDFGIKIKEYIDKYPETGMFTCYASRCHYDIQMLPGYNCEEPSILFHKAMADACDLTYHGQIVEINRRIAGHLMLINKKTWLRIRGWVAQRVVSKNILGVDTKISYAILNAGLKIRLMKGIYIFHYLRMAEGLDYKKHLE